MINSWFRNREFHLLRRSATIIYSTHIKFIEIQSEQYGSFRIQVKQIHIRHTNAVTHRENLWNGFIVMCTAPLTSMGLMDASVVRKWLQCPDLHLNWFAHFKRHHWRPASLIARDRSHQPRLLGSQRRQEAVVCWAALIEVAYVPSGAKWAGREAGGGTEEGRNKWQNATSKCGTRTLTRDSPVSHVGPLCTSDSCFNSLHVRCCWPHTSTRVHVFYEYSKVKWNEMHSSCEVATGSQGKLCSSFCISLLW